MNPESPSRVTLGEIENLLLSIGFEQPRPVDRSLVFQHTPTGVAIVLPKGDPNQTVSPADLLSVHFRLASHALANQAVLDALAVGRLPAA